MEAIRGVVRVGKDGEDRIMIQIFNTNLKLCLKQ